jgi:hypothetical protein
MAFSENGRPLQLKRKMCLCEDLSYREGEDINSTETSGSGYLLAQRRIAEEQNLQECLFRCRIYLHLV